MLGIVGDSGSGKTTVADSVAALLGRERVTDVHLDDYHRFSREERAEKGLTALNPAVHNLALMHEHLKLLRQGRPIRNRSYNHADGSFGPIRIIEPREIVMVRGLLGFPNDELQGLYHLSVFLQPEPELLFRWKLRRDVRRLCDPTPPGLSLIWLCTHETTAARRAAQDAGEVPARGGIDGARHLLGDERADRRVSRRQTSESLRGLPEGSPRRGRAPINAEDRNQPGRPAN